MDFYVYQMNYHRTKGNTFLFICINLKFFFSKMQTVTDERK